MCRQARPPVARMMLPDTLQEEAKKREQAAAQQVRGAAPLRHVCRLLTCDCAALQRVMSKSHHSKAGG